MSDLEILDEAQAAAALRVHPKTLGRWRRAGLIAYDRTPGGRIRYSWSDVLVFRRTMHVPPHAPECSDMSGEKDRAPS